MESDQRGDFTSFGAKKLSVIDYFLVAFDFLHLIKRLSVQDFMDRVH